MVVELMERYPINYKLVEKYATYLSENNSWCDIDYANKDRSRWAPKIQTEHILLMAKAYMTKSSPLYKKHKLSDAIHIVHRNSGLKKKWFSQTDGTIK